MALMDEVKILLSHLGKLKIVRHLEIFSVFLDIANTKENLLSFLVGIKPFNKQWRFNKRIFCKFV